MSLFALSDESRKISYWIYGYGSAAMLARLYAVNAAPSIGLIDLKGATLSSSGILSLPTYYFIVAFVARIWHELSQYQLLRLTEQYQLYKNLPSEIKRESESNPLAKQALKNIETEMSRTRLAFSWAATTRGFVEIGLPVMFSALCVYVTWRVAFSTVSDLVRRI